ncbi:divisome protein SepX/GlpR [Nocardioides nematodiphilus]|uniref:divisome protein SepX/GlpR n=1 Tax=Nocardioides nematodiphilus TaxID=2849669 RepID=UPI001CD99E73|nr:hypothetical protein [Nocardioides nematodiphilus]MCA1983170.1 hypothetical protein [Nocardioides nematodiphilus]
MSSLIFVAVAVAWAVYLVPKALEHHDESLRSRTVATFSHTMRVLARREAASSRTTTLVPGTPARVGQERAERAPDVPAQKSRSAARRRRNVLLTILLLNAGVAVAAGLGYVGWAVQAAPVTLLVAWLVACRLMVRRERSVRRMTPVRPYAAAPVLETEYDVEPLDASAEIVVGDVLDDDTQSVPVVAAEIAGSWDPVNVPLPTYVSKPPAARRTVRTIDLDSTGVWSSGRSEIDSALVAEADAAAREAKAAESEKRRATGS